MTIKIASNHSEVNEQHPTYVITMEQLSSEKETLVILLSIFVPGAGHIYIGKRRRGIFFLILVAATSAVPLGFVTSYVSVGIWIWQFLEIMKITRTMRSHNN